MPSFGWALGKRCWARQVAPLCEGAPLGRSLYCLDGNLATTAYCEPYWRLSYNFGHSTASGLGCFQSLHSTMKTTRVRKLCFLSYMLWALKHTQLIAPKNGLELNIRLLCSGFYALIWILLISGKSWNMQFAEALHPWDKGSSFRKKRGPNYLLAWAEVSLSTIKSLFTMLFSKWCAT